jgi:hypothetical protein
MLVQSSCLRSPRWRCPATLLAVMALLVLAGCATGAPRGSLLPGLRHRSPAPASFVSAKAQPVPASAPQTSMPDASSVADEDDDPEDDIDEAVSASAEGASAPQAPSHAPARRPAAGGDDPLDDLDTRGVGWPDGVGDGRTLSPEQALRLLPYLLSTEVTLGNFAQRRMAAHLLLEVATGDRSVSRQELHARMDRFLRLVVLRPDGYLALAVTGEAK